MLNEQARKRYNAFWDRTSFERCTLYLAKRKPGDSVMSGATVDEKWTDIDRRVLSAMETDTFFDYYAEGFASYFVNFGPGSLAPCIGGDFILDRNTIWFDRNPIIKDWNEMPEIAFDENSAMWKLMHELTKKASINSNGKYTTSISDIGGSLDIVASLRGTQELLYDLYDYPQQVKELHEEVERIWMKVYTLLYKLVKPYQCGVSTWVPLWCEKSYYTLQCDFCAMISPDMFKEFVKPSLKAQTEFLEHSIYHLDGPDAVKHLDDILDLPALDGIQWSQGDGRPNIDDECYFDMYNKIIKAGKSLVLLSVPFSGYENVLKHVSTKGLYIEMRVQDEKQAKHAIDIANSYRVK